MKLKTRDVGEAAVIEIHGKLIGGPDNSDKFHAFIKKLLDDGKNKIVINLKNTSWADSRGIGILIAAFTSAKNAGGNLVLAHVIDRIKDILAVTRLLLIFKTFETEKEAVDFLEKGADDG